MKRPKRPKKKDFRQIAFTRFMLIVAVFVLWIFGISARLVHLQVTQHAWLKEQALSKRVDVRQIRQLRGTIFDRNGRALAMSVRVKTLYADPSEIKDVETTASTLSKVLDLDAAQIAAQISEGKSAGKRYVAIARKLEEDVVQRINKALDISDRKKADLPNFTGLHWREDQKRSYPYRTLAAQVVGFNDAADEGRAGVEQSQEEVLHGKVVKKLQERDRLGRVYDETETERSASSDIVLTIDAAFQYMVEQALEKGVEAAAAKSGMAVVMNPKNGEILALANYPTFDPNTIVEASAEHIGNKAIQTVYSPGSVFKVVTYGSALEKNLISPDAMIDSGNGTIEVAKHVFKDSHGVGRVSYSQAMARSSNVCAIKTGLSVGRDDFAAMVRKMGFGTKTGIELPAETQGIVRPVERWNGDSLASMSIGYEIGVTALQMAGAFATIANNGSRARPHVIKEIRANDSTPTAVTQTQQSQVVTEATAKSLRTMLRQVVLTGTGRRAQLNGYSAAGKTGTAWKFNPVTKSVDPSKYISSFIGMAPADDPKIVVAVVMDEPKSGARDGGMVSAPVFREITQQILQEMRVVPDQPIKQEALTAKITPETPQTDDATKKAEPKRETDVRSKRTQAAPPKEKDPDVKKKDEKKKLPESGKLTARFSVESSAQGSEPVPKTRIET
ncbi:MAG TPA: penicillin-binding protein 2 [Pyrinomonadaceae bacterium]|nr:penicillin-binding protein 2 [Pyrinomonadaceae bacterium]